MRGSADAVERSALSATRGIRIARRIIVLFTTVRWLDDGGLVQTFS